MPNLNLPMIVNVFGIVLLAATVIYAYILNRKLNKLKSSSNGIGKVLNELGSAVTTLHTSISDLQDSAREQSDALGSKIEKAEKVCEDMDQVIKAAETAALRIEDVLRKSRRQGFMIGAGETPEVTPKRAPRAAEPEPKPTPKAPTNPAVEFKSMMNGRK